MKKGLYQKWPCRWQPGRRRFLGWFAGFSALGVLAMWPVARRDDSGGSLKEAEFYHRKTS